MRIYDIIAHKRDGFKNTPEEIHYLIQKCVEDAVPDEQLAAWLMAVYFQGMDAAETACLTEAMMHSGDVLDLSAIQGITVDKHSTGGVGDKTTLIVAPIAAAAGVPVAKLSGRGLGFTGGTIDKLEAIPHFQTTLSGEAFIRQVNDIGLAVIGQTANLVPADKKLYALRDVTATIESIPLIASSIMSKKLASGAQKIVLDVKYGSGAFMKTLDRATVLAQTMVDIARDLQRDAIAILSSMEQPLGYAVGNALEVREALNVLQGQGPEDLTKICLTLSGAMIYLHGGVQSLEEGQEAAQEQLRSGKALEKFLTFIQYQGGDVNAVLNDDLPKAQYQAPLLAKESGYIQQIDAMTVGVCSMLLGSGRERQNASIDLGAGVILQKKAGDYIQQGEPLATLFYNAPYQARLAEAAALLENGYQYSAEKPQVQPLISGIVQGAQN